MQMASIWSNMIAESHAGGLYLAAWSLSACVWFGGSATLAKRQGLSVPRTMAILILIIPLFVLGARAHALLFEAQLPLVRLVEEPSLLFRPGWRLPGGLLLGVPLRAVIGKTLAYSVSCFCGRSSALRGSRIGDGPNWMLSAGLLSRTGDGPSVGSPLFRGERGFRQPRWTWSGGLLGGLFFTCSTRPALPDSGRAAHFRLSALAFSSADIRG